MTNTIRIFKGQHPQLGSTWYSDMADTPDALEIKRLFGTTVLPTAFSTKVPAATVVTALQRLNPSCTVVERDA